MIWSSSLAALAGRDSGSRVYRSRGRKYIYIYIYNGSEKNERKCILLIGARGVFATRLQYAIFAGAAFNVICIKSAKSDESRVLIVRE